MYFLLSQTADLLSCAGLEGVSKSVKRWRKIIPRCIKGTMWRERERERNSRCFEDRPNSIHRFQWNYIVSFSFWCKEAEIEELELVDMLGSL